MVHWRWWHGKKLVPLSSWELLFLDAGDVINSLLMEWIMFEGHFISWVDFFSLYDVHWIPVLANICFGRKGLALSLMVLDITWSCCGSTDPVPRLLLFLTHFQSVLPVCSACSNFLNVVFSSDLILDVLEEVLHLFRTVCGYLVGEGLADSVKIIPNYFIFLVRVLHIMLKMQIPYMLLFLY